MADESATAASSHPPSATAAPCHEEVAALQAQIDLLKRERVDLVNQVEAEEEYITNVLQKRLESLQKEKIDLELSLEEEQEYIVNKLQKQMDCLRSGDAGAGQDSRPESILVAEVEALRCQLERQRCKLSEREQELQRQIAQIQAENHHLLQENIRLSQRIRRNSGSMSGGEEHSVSPPRHHGEPDQYKSGSISDLRRQSLSDSEGPLIRSRSKSSSNI